MSAQQFLVTGVTGNTGSRVAAGLRQLGHAVRGGSRTGTPPFDWDDPSTWRAALRGIDAVYIAAPMTGALRVGAAGSVGFRAAPVAEFVAAAHGCGVRRFVLLSGRSARANPASPYMIALEESVRRIEAEWTVLSPGVFNQNFLAEPLLSGIRHGRVTHVATGPVANLDFIDVADIAEVAVRTLTTPGHAGKVYELSGPRAFPQEEAVGIIGRTLGRDIGYVRVELDEWVRRARAEGLTSDSIDFVSVAARGHSSGAYSHPFDGVEQVLGRPPRSFEAFAREAAATGAWQ